MIDPHASPERQDADRRGSPAGNAPGVFPGLDDEPVPAGKKKKKKDTLGTSRGIETVFRTSYRVHVDLTSLADNKANIMISINGLIIPIMLFAVVPLLNYSTWLIAPSLVLVVTCLISIVYAVLSARPRVHRVRITLEDVQARRVNLLFFGNYTSLSETDFLQGMTALIQDPDQMYQSMMRDLYGMGRVLSRKFDLLQHAYTVFMIGLVASIGLFVLVFIGVLTGVIV